MRDVRLWTAAEDDKLFAMRDAGHRMADIAKALGRTLDATQFRVKRLKGCTRPPFTSLPTVRSLPRGWTDRDLERLRTMRGQGVPHAEIAQVLCRSQSALRKAIDRMRAGGQDVGPSPKAVREARTPEEERQRLEHRRAADREKHRRRRADARAARLAVIEAVKEPARPAPPASETPAPRRRRIVSILCAPVETARVADVTRHLDIVGHAAPWTPALDLALVEGLLSPRTSREAVLADVAQAAGLDRDAALARFRLLARPIRNAVGVLDTAGQVNLLAVLRERAPRQEAAA